MITPISDDVLPSMPATTRVDTAVVRSVRPAYGAPDRQGRSFPGDARPGTQEPR